MFKDKWSLYYDLITIQLVIAYAHGLHCHHTKMKMNKSSFQKI